MKFSYNKKRAEADAEEARQRGQGNRYLNLKSDGDKATGRFMPTERPRKGVDSELYVRYAHHYIRAEELYIGCLDQPAVSDYAPSDWADHFCELWKELKKSRDPDDQEEAKKYNVSTRYTSNFLVKDEEVARIFRFSGKTQPKIVELAFGTEYPDILDLEDGRDVEIKRKGEDLATDYIVTPKKDTYTISEKVLDTLNDLEDDIRCLSPKKQAVVAKGGEVDDDDWFTLRDLINWRASLGKGDGDKGADFERWLAAQGGKAEAPKRDEPEGRSDREERRGRDDDRKRRDRDDDRDERKRDRNDDEGGSISKRDAERLAAFAEELEVQLDFNRFSREKIEDDLAHEAVGSKVSTLSKAFVAWLEERGHDVSGRIVGEKGAAGKGGRDEGGEKGDVKSELQRIRERRGK